MLISGCGVANYALGQAHHFGVGLFGNAFHVRDVAETARQFEAHFSGGGIGNPPSPSALKSVTPSSLTNVHRTTELHTDESPLYTKVGKEFFAHKTVMHGWNQRGFYVGKDGQTTNAIENFFGVFKRSIKGTYVFCSEQHLQRYLAEFAFRYNNRSGLGVTDGERTAIALKGIEGKRLTYRAD